MSSNASSSYTKTESANLHYNNTQVDTFINALNVDLTVLTTTDTNLHNSIITKTNAINQISTAVALSATLPEVYLQIPHTLFIGVRKSDFSGDARSFNDRGTSFNSRIAFNRGATFSGPQAPMTLQQVIP